MPTTILTVGINEAIGNYVTFSPKVPVETIHAVCFIRIREAFQIAKVRQRRLLQW